MRRLPLALHRCNVALTPVFECIKCQFTSEAAKNVGVLYDLAPMDVIWAAMSSQRLMGERARLKSMHGVIGLPGCEEQDW